MSSEQVGRPALAGNARVGAGWGRTAVAAAAVVASVAVSLLVARADHRLTTIWLGNAVQIAAMLYLPERRRPWIVAAGAAACVLLTGLIGAGWTLGICAAVGNAGTVLLAATVLARDRDWVTGRKEAIRSWARFGGWAVLIAPAVGTVISIGLLMLVGYFPTGSGSWLPTAAMWFLIDAVAIAVLVPAALRLRRSALRDLVRHDHVAEAVWWAMASGGAATAVMSQHAVLWYFVMLMPMIVAVFRLGMTGFAIGTVAASAVVLGLARLGLGPFGTQEAGMRTAQVYILGSCAVLMLVVVLLDDRQRLVQQEDVNEELFRLITTTTRDLIFVTTLDGVVGYVSPAGAGLVGIPLSALMEGGWGTVMHPDDLDPSWGALQSLRDGADEVEVRFRLPGPDGDWHWFDCRMRRSSTGDGRVVGIARDVTGRVLREQQLAQLTAELRARAKTDPLTGLANRREFAECRRSLWHELGSRRRSLSLLVIDIDGFKSYNDRYGHLQGDECLVRLGTALLSTATRWAGQAARYGGEEFVVLLPDADAARATAVGEEIRSAVRTLEIPHADRPGGLVTVSVGGATVVPELDDDGSLFDAADVNLYRAKRAGRDAVVVTDLDLPGQPEPAIPAAPPDQLPRESQSNLDISPTARSDRILR